MPGHRHLDLEPRHAAWPGPQPPEEAGAGQGRRQDLLVWRHQVIIIMMMMDDDNNNINPSPYHGPPLYFTEEQLALLPQQEGDASSKLMDHNDLFVLDMAPSLKTLTILSIIKNKLQIEVINKLMKKNREMTLISLQGLPRTLMSEISNMTSSNCISKPLKTVESLPTG